MTTQDDPKSPWDVASSYTKAEFDAFCANTTNPALSTGASGSGSDSSSVPSSTDEVISHVDNPNEIDFKFDDSNYDDDPERIALASDYSILNIGIRNDDVVPNDRIDDVTSAALVPNNNKAVITGDITWYAINSK